MMYISDYNEFCIIKESLFMIILDRKGILSYNKEFLTTTLAVISGWVNKSRYIFTVSVTRLFFI